MRLLNLYAHEWIHKALRDWALVMRRPVSRLIRIMLILIPWKVPGSVIYSIAIPLREHQSSETLRQALLISVETIMAEWERSGTTSPNAKPDVEKWSNEQTPSGREDIIPQMEELPEFEYILDMGDDG